MPTFTFHAYAGARQSGKTSAAHDAWNQARCSADAWARAGRSAPGQMIDGGVIADPIDITAHDIEIADRADLEALASAAWLPGVTTETVLNPAGERIVRVSSTPCITTMGA